MFGSKNIRLRSSLATLAIMAQGVYLSGCGVAPQPDHDIYYVCADRADDVRSVTLIVSDTAAQFGYSFADRGEQARSNLTSMDANPVIVPDEVPVLAVVRNHRRKVVLVISNFGFNSGDLEIDFLYFGSQDRPSEFSQGVLAALDDISTVRVYPENGEAVGSLADPPPEWRSCLSAHE